MIQAKSLFINSNQSGEIETDSMTLVGLYEDAADLEALMISVQEDLDNEKLAFTSVYTNIVDSLDALVMALTADSTYEIALKRNYEILVSYLRDSSVVQTDLDDLADIATECMDEFGSAVPNAQNLLIALGKVYNKKDSCSENNFNQLIPRIIANKNNSVFLLPNPSNGQFEILLTEDLFNSKLCEISIFDITGKSIYYQHIKPNFGKIKIEYQNLLSGIYYLQLDQAGTRIQKKLIITH
jgi:hypothetical protein